MQLKQARLMIFNLCLIAVSVYYAALSAAFERYFLSGCILLVTGFILFALYYRSTKNYLNARGIFLTSWFLSMGLAALKLHSLEKQWVTETWICLGVTPFMFLLGYELHDGLIKHHGRVRVSTLKIKPYHTIVGLSAVIFFIFAVEVIGCRGVPLINRQMGAYAEFGLPYLHYITVSCVLVTPLSLVFFYRRPPLPRFKRMVVLACNLVMLSIPILLVSRQLLIMEMFLIFATFAQMTNVRRISIKFVLIFIAILSGAWVLFSIFRQQTAAYIRGALRISAKSAIFLIQAFMYIACNFDNFDLLVAGNTPLSFGFQSLTPVWTFTGLKPLFAKTLEEATTEYITPFFNTFPFITAPYTDFRLPGIIAYTLIIGVVASLFENKARKNRRGVGVVSNSVYLYCLLFSFFTSFFSAAVTWVYFLILFLAREFTLPPKETHGRW